MNDVQRIKQKHDPDLFVRLVQERQAMGMAPKGPSRRSIPQPVQKPKNRRLARMQARWKREQRNLLALEAVVFTGLMGLLWAAFALGG